MTTAVLSYLFAFKEFTYTYKLRNSQTQEVKNK